MKFDLDSFLEKMATNPPAQTARYAGSKSRYSLGIVNSRSNGKRITLSKSLATALKIEDSVEIIPVPEEGVLLMSKAFLPGLASSYELRGDEDGRRILYNTEMVKALVEDFGLDYSHCVSRSFSDISVKTDVDAPIATIVLKDLSTGLDAEESEQAV